MNMKKNVIIACTALLLAGSAKAQITYFSTGFDEGMPSAFTLHDVDGRTPSTDMQILDLLLEFHGLHTRRAMMAIW